MFLSCVGQFALAVGLACLRSTKVGMTVDEDGFADEMAAQKTRSKQAEAARRFVAG